MNEKLEEVEYDEDMPNEEVMSARLQALGGRIHGLVMTEVGQRGLIENRWIQDLRQYHGQYEPNELEKMREAKSSQIFVNITRNKTNAAEARLSDMLFPTDDKNWGIRPTPVPELNKAIEMGDQSQRQQATAIMREARERSDAMADEIDDQLNESNYAARARDAIHDACVLGTGILKGPVIVGRTKRRWETDEFGNSIALFEEDLSAAAHYVDPWNFYPEGSATKLSEAEYTLERHYITRKELIRLAKNPAYLPDEIRAALQDDAVNSQTTHNWTSEMRAISGVSEASKNSCYEMWEFNGLVDKADLEACGCEVDEDELTEYVGTILVIGSHVIRASVHPMDTEDEIYHVFNWAKDGACIFGFGVPYLLRSPQKVINAAWRMVLDNAGISAGPQIVYDADAIEPENGRWDIEPRKLWKKKKSTIPVREAFEVYQIQCNQGELMNIVTMARQFADEETNLPLIAQGEQASHVTQTAHGMEMLMNSANIVLRSAVKNFDDDVTEPLITAFYNWNMQFNDKPNIKGDFAVDARGSSALLAREMQQERLMAFTQVAGSNEEFALRTDWDGLYKELVKHMQVSAESVMLDEAEFKQLQEQRAQQPPPVDPIEQGKLQLKQQEMQAMMQIKQAELQQDGQLRMAEIASREKITIAQLQENTGLKLEEIKTKRDIAAGDMTLKQSDILLKQRNMEQGFDSFS